MTKLLKQWDVLSDGFPPVEAEKDELQEYTYGPNPTNTVRLQGKPGRLAFF